jgi:membrane protein YqaA with SNARE-associated domain
VGESVRGAIELAAFFTTHTLDRLLSQFGYAAVFAFVMVESLGVPFPGETMLISAALYASLTHHLVVWLVWAAAAAGAIIGDNIGYAIGYHGAVTPSGSSRKPRTRTRDRWTITPAPPARPHRRPPRNRSLRPRCSSRR